MREIDTYNEKKIATIKRLFGDELKFSTYYELRDMGIAREDICKIYGIPKGTLYGWLKRYEDNLKKVN